MTSDAGTFGQSHQTAILGAAWRLSIAQLAPFVCSLQKSGYNGDVVLFTNEVEPGVEDWLRSLGVNVRPYKGAVLALPGGRRIRPYDPRLAVLHPVYSVAIRAAGIISSGLQRTLALRLMGVWSSRYFLYYEFLQHTSAAKIILTDVKDVVFQTDPSTIDCGGDVMLFLEDERRSIGECPINSDLVLRAFGPGALREVADQPISCSGVTIGARGSVLSYCKLMVEHAARATHQIGGLDQGVHNVLIKRGAIPNARIIPNGAGPVLTMGYMARYDTDSEGRVLGVLGEPAPIVHQYDRHAPLLAQTRARFLATAPGS